MSGVIVPIEQEAGESWQGRGDLEGRRIETFGFMEESVCMGVMKTF